MNRPDACNILECAEDAGLVARPALPEDAMDVLHWRNDPKARAMSRQDGPIDEAVHRAWYSQVLSDPDRLLIIGVLVGQKIGMVRFDRRQLPVWEVSITLVPEVRGRGLGRRLLEMALKRLHSVHGSAEVLAAARSSNEPSVKLFRSLGFLWKSDDGQLMSLVLPPDADRRSI